VTGDAESVGQQCSDPWAADARAGPRGMVPRPRQVMHASQNRHGTGHINSNGGISLPGSSGRSPDTVLRSTSAATHSDGRSIRPGAHGGARAHGPLVARHTSGSPGAVEPLPLSWSARRPTRRAVVVVVVEPRSVRRVPMRPRRPVTHDSQRSACRCQPALKGRCSPAQGNALGKPISPYSAP
jgi:hypothetical protein